MVFLFVARLLIGASRELDPADYDRIGALGRITSPIREGGTGEITFSRPEAATRVGPAPKTAMPFPAAPRSSSLVTNGASPTCADMKNWRERKKHQQPTD